MLCCVYDTTTQKILKQFHGPTDSRIHISGHFATKSTAFKILRTGYYWPFIFKYYYKFTQACNECQTFVGREQFSTMPLLPVLLDFPFSKWGLYFIPPINPPSYAGHNFILTTTYYFTKWTDVFPLKNAHDEHVINFLESNIFSRFSLPLEIIYDNGPTFISAKFTQFLNKFGVNHFTSSTYYPQGNGKVDSKNKNLIKILKKIINENPHRWHTLIVYSLWADQTTTKTSIGHTPFQLLYGQEAIIPIKLELNSLRLALQDKELNSTSIPQIINALLSLEEQRRHALENLKKRQRFVKRYFDKKSKSTSFEADEKVLLWDSAHADRGKHSKFQIFWLGPYKITYVIGNNSYLLKDMDG
jgi:hypothetical protein